MACSATAFGIGPGRGTHFVNTWRLASASAPRSGSELAAELAHDVLGRPVDVRQVERREAGVEVVEQAADGGGRVDGAVGAGHLPHADRQPADGQVGGKSELTGRGEFGSGLAHGRLRSAGWQCIPPDLGLE